MAVPSFDAYYRRARALYPQLTDEQIAEGYRQTFGRDPVRTVGPSREQYAQRARELYPDISKEQIDEAYERQYGAPAGTELGRALRRGLGQLMGWAVGMVNRGDLERTAEAIREFQAANAPSAELQQAPWYDPEKIAAAVVQTAPSMAPSLIGGGTGAIATRMLGAAPRVAVRTGTAIGAGLGGSQEALGLYEERTAQGVDPEQAQREALTYGLGSAALSTLPLSRIFGRAPGRLLTGALEAATEIAEEPLAATITGEDPLEATARGAQEVGPAAFLLGAGLGAGPLRSPRTRDTSLEEQAFRERLGLGAAGQRPIDVDELADAWRMANTPVPPLLALPRPPDFVVGPEGIVRRPGEEVPPPLALPAPRPSGEFAVTPEGVAREITEAEAEAAARTRAERQALGLGEAERIAARMADVAAWRAIPDLPTPQEREAAALRAELERMKDEVGWFERGGRLLRNEETGEVIGRTVWIPRAEWWPERPHRMSEEEVRNAIDRHLAGEPLSRRQQDLIHFLTDVARTRMGISGYEPMRTELLVAGLGDSIDNTMETALVARAVEADEAAVERAAIQYEDDPDAFLRQIRAILARAQAPDSGPLGPGATAAAPGAAGELAAGELAAGAPAALRVSEPAPFDEDPYGDFEADAPANVFNPIDRSAPPAAKLAQLKALTAENVPRVQRIVDDLNAQLPGSFSKLNVKRDDRILEKAARPSIRETKPWFDVEHIRDALRFKTVVDRIEQLPAVVDVLRAHNVEVVKIDTRKLLRPDKWGWRIVALDLRMPNGQLVEHYMPLRELEEAKNAGGHQLFEKWRNRDFKKLSAAEQAAFLADLARSRALYQRAWEAFFERTGLDESAVRASLYSFSASARSLTRKPSSSVQIGTSSRQTPLMRLAAKPTASTVTSEPSQDLLTTNLGVSTGESIPQEGVTSPFVRPDEPTGVAAPRNPYRRARLLVGSRGEQLAFDFEVRPGTTERQAAIGRDAVAALLAYRDRRSGAQVLGLGIPQEFAAAGSVSLVGRRIQSPAELAQLAQVYRDPRFETMRVFFLRGDEIVHHSGLTSRLPGGVNFRFEGGELSLVTHIREQMAAHGADGYYLLHNHPSGSARPSGADMRFTRLIAESVPGFRGHVVIDYDEYAHIDARGTPALVRARFGGYHPRRNPVQAHEALFQQISSPADLARVAESLKQRQGFVTVIAVDAQMRVRAISEYPDRALDVAHERYPVILARLERLRRGSGGVRLFAVGGRLHRLRPLLRSGVITDAIDQRGFQHSDVEFVTETHPLDARLRTVRVEETPASYQRESAGELGANATGAPPSPPRPERVEVGGGSYSMAQFGRLTDAELRVLEGVMRDFEPAIEAERRGTRTWDATEKEAARLIQERFGFTLDSLVNRKPGSTANAELLEAYGTILATAAQDVTRLAERAAATNSNEDLLALAAARERLGVLLAPAMGYRTEAGRALNVLRKVAADFRRADELLAALGDGSGQALRDFAKRVRHAGSLDQVLAVTRASYQATTWDKVYEYWINMGLLSGPTTHSVNIVSNALFQVLETAAEAVAAAISRDVSFTALRARLAAIPHGATVGLKNARIAFATEEAQLVPGDKLEFERRQAIPGLAGRIIRIPGRALLAEDEFFKGVAFHMELADLAMQEAIERNPRDPKAEFDRIMGDIGQRRDLIERARQAALRATFTTPLGPVMGTVSYALTKSKIGRVLVPFIRTPTNIIKRAIEYTPAAPVFEEVRNALAAGGRDAALARARMMVGSGVMMGVVALAAQGLISGAGPDDTGERELLMRRGWQPYSIKLPDGSWVRYNRFEPFGMLMGIAADLYELGSYVSEGELENIGSMIITSFALNLGDKTFLKGITDFAQAYADPQRYFAQWARDLAASFVPNVGAQTARYIDPFQREARTLTDAILARVPVMREQTARRLDIAGEPAQSTQGFPGNPLQATTPRADPLADAMLRLGVFKERPSRDLTIQGVTIKLEPEEYEPYAAFIQRVRWTQLTPLVQSPQFRALAERNPVKAQELLEKAWDRLGTEARTAYLYQHPELIARSAQAARSSRVSGPSRNYALGGAP